MISVINNVLSLTAQHSLRRSQAALNTSLERLSTGLRINRASDDPAGLIASENLRFQIAGVTASINNATRASNILSTAEGGLNEVSSLLTQLQGVVTASANEGGLSIEEKAANQLQVDSILQTIDRLSGGTVFAGRKLLDGSFDYNTSGVDTTRLRDLRINSAPANLATTVLVNVTQSAQAGHLTYTGGVVTSGGVTIEVAGTKGSTQLSFASGTTVTAIAAAITSVKAATGVSAFVNAGNVDINSTGFGAAAFVSVRTVAGTFTGAGRATGRNASVSVNGSAASVDGLSVRSTGSGFNLAFSLANLANTVGATSFAITGGGATFQTGPSVTTASYASIGLAAISTAGLGNLDLGFLSSLRSGGANAVTGKSLTGAQDIVTASIGQVATLRGRIGAFIKYDLGSTVNNLEVQLENLTAAESAIRDADYATEVSNLTRAQILVQAGASVLAQANQSPQIALQLLRGATGR